jgi:probable rRNA maturation factor
LAVYFHAEKINYTLKGKRKVRDWVCRVIDIEGRETGEINIIFTSDSFLLEINKQYLDRNYYTDIITFDYGDGKIVSGDMYLSIERIMENAKELHISIRNELLRVIIHGILHMIGYSDKTKKAKKEMTGKENHYLELMEFGKTGD